MVLICKILSPFSLKDVLCQVWPCGSGEKECFTWLMYLHYKVFPLGKGHSSLFEENWNPFLQKYCFPSLIEITSGSGDEDLNLFFFNLFSQFRKNLLSEKGMVLHLNKLESPLTKRCFVLSLFEIGSGQLFWRKDEKDEMFTDRRPNGLTTWDQKSSPELKQEYVIWSFNYQWYVVDYVKPWSYNTSKIFKCN